MKTYVLSDYREIEKLITKSNKFADQVNSSLPFHRLRMPLLWWKHFSSEDDVDFGVKRGRNFYGSKSWLRKLSFIIVENNGVLYGIAPLFVTEVLIDREQPLLKLLSFSPDSGLFFYQDFLVLPERASEVISLLFNKIDRLIISEKLVFFIGHIPENSVNIHFYRDQIAQRCEKGWMGGETINCWRGGVYPWNIKKMSKVLNSILSCNNLPQDFKIKIIELTKYLQKQTAALMLFASTRGLLEKQILEIVQILEKQPDTELIAKEILGIMADKPIAYPYKKIPKDIDLFYASLTKSKRYYYKRYLKKYYKAGGIFEVIDPEDVTSSDIKDYLSLHVRRWEDESAAVNEKTISFHEESAFEMAKNDCFRLFFAKINNRRIAVLSCFDINGRREFYYSGRSMDNHKLRAGKLLVAYAVIDAIQRNMLIFDFGYGDDEYKFDFTDKVRNVISMFLTQETSLPDLEKLFPMYERIVLDS